jgi:hypothetical protein
MKIKALLVAGAVIAVAVPNVASAASGGTTRDSATGGGQAFFDRDDPTGSTGAGDTVAFQAQHAKGAAADSTDATGQIQVNRRTTNIVKFHGTIDCLAANGSQEKDGVSYAYMSGTSRANKTAPAQPFELFVQDGGSGPQERNDVIALFVGNETTQNDSDNEDRTEVCGFSDFDREDDPFDLYRGNVQVRNRSVTNDVEPDPGSAAALSVASLF